MVTAVDRVDAAPPEILPSLVRFPGEEPAAGLGPAAFLHALRRQCLVGALIGSCLAAAAAAAAWFLFPSNYTSTAYLRVSSRQAPLVFETVDRVGVTDFKTYLATQQQLMLTPFVLNGALRDPNVAALPRIRDQASPVEWLQKELKVKSDAEILKVSLSDSEPKTAMLIVNGVVDSYLAEIVDAEKNDRDRRLQSLVAAQESARRDLKTKTDALQVLADNTGASDTESLSLAQQAALQQWSLVRSELTNVQFELMKAKGELEVRNGVGDADVAAASDDAGEAADPQAEAQVMSFELDRAVEADPIASGMVRDIERLRGSVAEARRKLSAAAAAPYVAKYEAQLKEAEGRLAERRTVLQTLLTRHVPAADGAAGLALKIAVLEKQEAQLGDQVTDLEAAAKKLGRSSIEVEMKRSEIASVEGVLNRIGQEIEHTKIEQGVGSRIEPISRATAAVAMDLEKRAAVAAFGGLAGLCLPIALLVWRDASRRRVDGTETVTGVLRLDVLGVVPRIPQRTMKRLAGPSSSAARWRGRLSESINAVAAMVQHKAAVEDKRVIVVSSAVAGEGKTTLAGQLASRLGELGHRTLLIDFDLRRPTLHEAFDVSTAPGMSDLLDRAAELDEVVQATGQPNLSLITAGSREPNVLQAASKALLRDFFAAVRAEYEFVIVDSSPVLPVVDTRLIGQFADGVILSVLKDVSEAPKVSAALSLLNVYRVPVFGTVVTGCSQDVYYRSRRLVAVEA